LGEREGKRPTTHDIEVYSKDCKGFKKNSLQEGQNALVIGRRKESVFKGRSLTEKRNGGQFGEA